MTTTAAPVSTMLSATTVPVTTMVLQNESVIGPNSYGVPEHFVLLPSDAGCRKCHGTGYKKTLLTRKWKPCKKCGRKYGYDASKINVDPYPVTGHHGHHGHHGHETTYGTAAPYYGTTGTTMVGSTSSGLISGVQPMATTSAMPTTTIYTTTGASTMGTTSMLPSGFQTLPANPQCVKCSGTGYHRSRKTQNWKGCQACAQQYGTNLSTVMIPQSYSSTTGTIGAGNLVI